jgi:NAD(P)-dependent dehydrogenase (short-subunit alcohol dehydrogenase family)
MSEQRGIFITGASTGLGFAAAKLFAGKGWRVVATLRRPDSAEGKALAELGGVEVLKLDVTRPEQIVEAARQAVAAGPIDVVFNNAGYGLAGPIEGTTEEQLTAQVSTNLLGVIRTTQAFVPYFRERKRGLFLNTTSIGGLVAFPLFSVYHATKWAVEGFSESAAFELGELGITVKTLSPGGIKTDFASRSLVVAQHPAYDEMFGKVVTAFQAPERAATASTAEQIAEVAYEAATDGKAQLRYVAGGDAQALYAQRKAAGDEAFRAEVKKRFLG